MSFDEHVKNKYPLIECHCYHDISQKSSIFFVFFASLAFGRDKAQVSTTQPPKPQRSDKQMFKSQTQSKKNSLFH